MAWLFLIGAILFEVAGTLSLRMATHGKKIWIAGVAIVNYTGLVYALTIGWIVFGEQQLARRAFVFGIHQHRQQATMIQM